MRKVKAVKVRFMVRATASIWATCLAAISGLCLPATRDIARAHEKLRALFPIVHRGRFGFIDLSGNITIPARFLWASEFSEGRSAVLVCRKYGYIDEAGRIVIAPQYDAAGKFSEDRAPVKIGKEFGFIDKTGRIVIPPKYDSVFVFSEGQAGAVVGGREGVIDKQGAWVIQPRFDDLLGFSEGLSATRAGNRWGFIDARGETSIAFQYKTAGSFADGRAIVVTEAGETELIDTSGRVVLRNVNAPWGFSERLAPAQVGQEDSYRYIDVNGRVAIAGSFDTALPFAEGLAPVENGGRWGFIDKAGKFLIEPRFDDAERFSRGLANVKLGGKWGIIDRSGAFVVQPQFDEILGAAGDFDQVSISKDEWGYIDQRGRVFWRAPESERPRYGEQSSLEELTQKEIEADCSASGRN
jgi:hypothetical protein